MADLEAELQFYQASSARAITDRHVTLWGGSWGEAGGKLSWEEAGGKLTWEEAGGKLGWEKLGEAELGGGWGELSWRS